MATAIFNAIFGNVMGVFLTPILSIWLLGGGKGVSLLNTLNSLGGVVILPLILGKLMMMVMIMMILMRMMIVIVTSIILDTPVMSLQ